MMMKNSNTPKEEFYSSHRVNRERGMVSAEAAFAILGITSVFALLLYVCASVVTYFHAQDLSKMAARSASLGNSKEVIVKAVQAEKETARVSLHDDGEYVEVKVSVPLPVPLNIVAPEVTSSAVAYKEPGV